ncbi:ribbon-helix-helix protein, CopG family [Paraburkholderia sp. Ac-20347]|uniref:ribbon-helix-helix protein, CopG family n=1 Tax=Paraburkholderia sp. Ac-20347 TaxID=2703892 RepID=UPI00197D9DC7|nr:ribbon-helix-helix protein, CopG family [Paraburkholderia sp. Ac-20347]MBN3813655.1 ribbon-helix-helix protein, CopG family [Paraburkholderia sp. Ac-20347]
MHIATIPELPYETSRALSTRVPPELHKRLRVAAAERDATVSTLIRVAVEQYLDAELNQ